MLFRLYGNESPVQYFYAAIAMVARQLKETRLKVMDGPLYAVYIPKLLRNYLLLFKTFYIDTYRHYVC